MLEQPKKTGPHCNRFANTVLHHCRTLKRIFPLVVQETLPADAVDTLNQLRSLITLVESPGRKSSGNTHQSNTKQSLVSRKRVSFRNKKTKEHTPQPRRKKPQSNDTTPDQDCTPPSTRTRNIATAFSEESMALMFGSFEPLSDIFSKSPVVFTPGYLVAFLVQQNVTTKKNVNTTNV